MRASATPDQFIASILFDGEEWDERLEKRLDHAEKKLPRNPRDRDARKKQGKALHKMTMAAAGSREDFLRALIIWLEAHLAVLEAEPDEYRDWLPEYIRIDPAAAIAAEISRTEVEIADLKRHQTRPRASQIESTHERRRRGQLESLAAIRSQEHPMNFSPPVRWHIVVAESGEPEPPPNPQGGFATEEEASEFHATVLRGEPRLAARPVPDRLR